MNEPYFSILIPVYKNVEFLHDCLKSIIKQDFTNYEVIVCYQGDTEIDKSVSDVRIHNIYLEKPSLYLARIESYSMANGKYVLFVDSDDELLEGALGCLRQKIKTNQDADIIQFSYTSTKDNIVSTNLKPSKDLMSREEYLSYFLSELGTYPIWRKCYKHNKVQFYFEDIFMGEDALLSLAFILHAKVIVSIDDTLYYYRPNAKSGTSNLKPKYLDDLAIFLIHSFAYRKSKREIEMAIYSFINEFLIFHGAFPKHDLLSLEHVRIIVDKILSYDFATQPAFVKRYFIKIVKSDISRLSDNVYILSVKAFRKIGHSFRVIIKEK